VLQVKYSAHFFLIVSSDGLPQSLGPLSGQHVDQRARLPGRRADEGLQDQALAIDQHRDCLSILAIEGGEETHQLERYVALGRLRSQEPVYYRVRRKRRDGQS